VVVLVLALTGAIGSAKTLDVEVKWSQPPVELTAGIYNGWDEVSMVDLTNPALPDYPIVADDFLCNDPRPIVDLHWWGSYPGYLAAAGTAVPVRPSGFLINFWSDIPDPNPNEPDDWSQPGDRLWTIICREYLDEEVGIDLDPRTGQEDTLFQYNQKFKPEEYFKQIPDTIYWVSIQAFWDDTVDRNYDWGWKTRPHFWNDDAVVGMVDAANASINWIPIIFNDESWDMAYELSVPEPCTLALMACGSVLLLRRRKR
jgi:hypothetical protein